MVIVFCRVDKERILRGVYIVAGCRRTIAEIVIDAFGICIYIRIRDGHEAGIDSTAGLIRNMT